jgi:hypothetical protein
MRHLVFNRAVSVSWNHIAVVERDGTKFNGLARDIKVGDRLGRHIVSHIAEKVSDGVYAPLTQSGTLIVDGGTFSCYSDVNLHSIVHYFVKGLFHTGLVETRNVDTAFTRLGKLAPYIPSFLQ